MVERKCPIDIGFAMFGEDNSTIIVFLFPALFLPYESLLIMSDISVEASLFLSKKKLIYAPLCSIFSKLVSLLFSLL